MMHKPTAKSQTRVARFKHGVQTARGAVRALRQRMPPPVKRALRRTTHWTLHSMLGVWIAIALIFGAAVLWLPMLAERKGEIESYLSSTAGNPVTFGTLDTFWVGLNPGVRVRDFRMNSASTGRPAIHLKEVRLSLAWWPLFTGRIAINSLVLVEPSLAVERQADGSLRVSGIETAAVPTAGDTDFLKLLLAQNELVIENGELLWVDRRAGAEPDRLAVKGVALKFRNNGDRHRLDFSADFPRDLCAECRISADLHGDLGDKASAWRGEIDVRARALSTRGLPRVLRERLPAGLEGRFDLKLASRWRAARPEKIDGQIAVSGLMLPLSGEPRPLAIQALDAGLSWQGDAQSWRLELTRLRLGLTRAPWTAGRLNLDVRPERVRFDVEHVDVADLAAFAISSQSEHALLGWLRATQPAGALNRLRFELSGPLMAPTAYNADSELRAIHFAAHERLPGVRGLSGQLSLSEVGGEFQLDSGDLEIALPNLLREPLALQRLESLIRWRKNPDDWFVQAQDIVMKARDGRARGDLELRLPKDQESSPILKMRADFSDGDGRHTARYIPLNLPEGLRAWIARAVVSGRITDGHVLYHGALSNFPFRDGKGRFEARMHVADGVLEYFPGWAPLRDINADLYFTGANMLITATHGRIRGLDVERVAVAIDDFKAPKGVLVAVQARVTGALQDTLGVLSDSQIPRFVALAPAGMTASGNGILTLDLRIPLHAPQKSGIAGVYRFQNNNLEFPFRAIRAENIQGDVEFNEGGLRAGKLDARLLGGKTVFEVLPAVTPADAPRIEARGAISQAGFTQAFGPALSPYLVGQAPWQARLLPGRAGVALRFESDLSGLELRLPAPLAKAQGEPLTLVVDSSPADAGMQVFDVRAGKRMSAKLAFKRQASGLTFARGRMGIGETVTQLPVRTGLHLSARLPALDTDLWWPLLRQNLNDSGASGWPDVVSRVSAEIEALKTFGREVGRLSLEIGKTDGNWQGRLQGDAIVGNVAITRAVTANPPLVAGNVAAPGRSVIHLKLEKLLLPARIDMDDTPTDPRNLPPLHVQSQSFTFAGLNLGELEFSALPVTDGWKITSLKLTRPESSLTASGLWEVDSRAQHTTRLDAALTSMDLGTLLETLGYAGEVTGGKLTAESNWSWLGAPAAFRLAKTDGNLTFTLNKGRIPKIRPGAGRLLGALDLQSITRYLTLDFSNVFSKGLTFDKIKGQVAVEKGNAYTRDLDIRTPGASLNLSGRVGLAARDLDLEIGVTPHLMEELALTGGLIGGPVVGAAVVVLHNLIKKPFEKSTRIDYTVKGKWDDPAVTRVTPLAAASEEQQ